MNKKSASEIYYSNYGVQFQWLTWWQQKLIKKFLRCFFSDYFSWFFFKSGWRHFMCLCIISCVLLPQLQFGGIICTVIKVLSHQWLDLMLLVNYITMITLTENLKHNPACLNILVGVEYVIAEKKISMFRQWLMTVK